MRVRRIALLVLALSCGGGAAALAVVSGRTEAPKVGIAPARSADQVLVASQPIGVGERLDPAKLTWQDWPQDALRDDYVSRAHDPEAVETLSGTMVRFEIFPGEPILTTKLVRSDQGYLSAVLEKGMRAVSVEVSAAAASGGYIMPNDRVDVVLTTTDGAAAQSETLLTNIKVLAIGLRLGEAGQSGAAADRNPQDNVFQDAAIAILELAPGETESVINGSRQGALSLVLRALADTPTGSEPLVRAGTPGNVHIIRFGNATAVEAHAPTPSEVSSR